MAVIAVESVVKNSFVKKGVEARWKGQYKAELILLPHLYVKPLKTVITAILYPAVQICDVSRIHLHMHLYHLHVDYTRSILFWALQTPCLSITFSITLYLLHFSMTLSLAVTFENFQNYPNACIFVVFGNLRNVRSSNCAKSVCGGGSLL